MRYIFLPLLCLLLLAQNVSGQETVDEAVKKHDIAKKLKESADDASQDANSVVAALQNLSRKKAALDAAKVAYRAAKTSGIAANIAAAKATLDAGKVAYRAAKRVVRNKIAIAEKSLEVTKENVNKAAHVPQKTSAVKNIMEDNILLLTAADFDFSGKFKTNYVGHLNIYAPKVFKWPCGKNKRIGINSGIMRLNYRINDTGRSSGSSLETFNITPLKSTSDTNSKYLRQLNNYKAVVNNRSWSLYFQPMFHIAGKGETGSNIYAHLHAELVISQWTINTIRNTVAQDTLSYKDIDSNKRTNRLLTPENVESSVTKVSGYFGAGITCELEISDNGLFFFQPTFGRTTVDNFILLDNGSAIPSSVTKTGDFATFYLIRAYYVQKLGEATVTVGTDIRGYLNLEDGGGNKIPAPVPQYATYIGLNIKLKSLVELFAK